MHKYYGGDYVNRIKTKKRSIPKKITKKLDIPDDIIFDIPRIIALSNTEIRIENYKSIMEYEPEKITLLSRDLIIIFRGKELNISIITDDEISICGVVSSVEFSDFRS